MSESEEVPPEGSIKTNGQKADVAQEAVSPAATPGGWLATADRTDPPSDQQEEGRATMNVSGVGTPVPIPAPVPHAPAPSPTERAPTEAAEAAPSPEKKSEADKAREEAKKLPPLPGLTVNEVRVMLGAMPASVARELSQNDGMSRGIFDVYA